MITVAANTPGQPAPIVIKEAGQKLSVLIDFKGRLREDHFEKLVKIIALQLDGANIERSRCNSGQFVQLDFGVEEFAAGKPYIMRKIELTLEVCPEGELSASIMLQVFP